MRLLRWDREARKLVITLRGGEAHEEVCHEPLQGPDGSGIDRDGRGHILHPPRVGGSDQEGIK